MCESVVRAGDMDEWKRLLLVAVCSCCLFVGEYIGRCIGFVHRELYTMNVQCASDFAVKHSVN